MIVTDENAAGRIFLESGIHGSERVQMQTMPTEKRQGNTSHGSHPTQKPLALIDRCLRASSSPGDLVLDPFCGSGTTGVAAISLGRRFIGIEKDAAYRKLSQERIQAAIERPQNSHTVLRFL
jgi:site-specific DNA-methyltransferase (adenine-specific)